MNIEYTPSFHEAMDNLLSCGQKFYTHKILSTTINTLKKYRDLLKANPLLGSTEPLLNNLSIEYRSLVIYKHIKLIYFIYEDVLYFADIWDTRQSEDSLRERIN